MRLFQHLAFALLACTSLTALGQGKYAYLHETTNEILRIQRSAMKLSPSDATNIAVRVCKTLEVLRKDENFAKDVKELSRAAAEQSAHHRQLADDLVSFLDSFVVEETDALLKARLAPDVVPQITAAAGTLRGALREPTNVEQLHKNIEKLRSEACMAATTLSKAQDDEKSREQRRKTLRRWGLGLGGVSMIAADALGTGLTVGVSTASFALGVAAVDAAVAQ